MNWKKFTSLALAGVMASSVMLAGCGNSIDKDAVVATLDGKEITLGLANFMAQYQAVSYDSQLLSYYGETMWEEDLFGTGETMTATVKNDVLESLKLGYVLEQHMDEYKVELTDEEMAAINDTAKKFMEDNEGDAADAMGAEEEYVAEMLRLTQIQTKMQEAIEAGADTEVSDEEAAQRTFSYIEISADTYTDDEGNTVELTEEEKEWTATTAAEMAEAAKSDFEGTAEEYAYTVNTYSYGADEDNSTMDEVVTTAADKLKEGEVSELLTAADGTFYIIRLDSEFDETATEEKKKSIIADRQYELYTEVTDGYLEGVEWVVDEELWEQVDFDELYTVKAEESTESTDLEVIETTEAVDGTEN